MTPMTRDPGRISRRTAIQGIAALAGTGLVARPALAQSGAKLLFMEPFDLAFEYMHEMNGVVGGHFQGRARRPDRQCARHLGRHPAGHRGPGAVTRVGALDLIKASAAQDVKLVSIATSLHEAIFSLVSLKSAPYDAPDMKGKTIGVASMGGGQENTLDLILASGGVSPKDVPRQAIGSNAGNVELLEAGPRQRLLRDRRDLDPVAPRGRARRDLERVEIRAHAGRHHHHHADFVAEEPRGRREIRRAMRNSAKEILGADPNMIVERIEKKYDISASKDRAFRIEAVKAYNGMTRPKGEKTSCGTCPRSGRRRPSW